MFLDCLLWLLWCLNVLHKHFIQISMLQHFHDQCPIIGGMGLIAEFRNEEAYVITHNYIAKCVGFGVIHNVKGYLRNLG